MKLMKTKLTIAGMAVCAGLALSACNKEEASTAPQTPTAREAAPSTAAKAVDAVGAAATQVTTEAAAQVKGAEQQAQGLIDRVKSLVSEQKYQDALTSLGELRSLKLTPDQQKLVDGLKTQIQTALAKNTAADPAAAVGGVLGGKK